MTAVIFEDPSLPHQIVIRSSSHDIVVTCNCLLTLTGTWPVTRVRRAIEIRPGVFPAAEAVAAWRAWHEREGISL